MKKFLLKLFIVLSSALLLIVLIFFTDSFDELVHIMKYAKAPWLAAGFGCMTAYWALDASILHILALAMLERQPLKDSIRVTMIGQFFNAITPLSGAGQPVQAYVMVKDGVKPGHAASIIILKTVLHQFVIVLYSIAAFIFRGSWFAANIPQFYYFFILGLLVNTAFLAVYLLFLLNRQAAKKVLVFIFKVLGRLKLLKNPGRTEKKTDSELSSFSEGASVLWNRKSMLIKLTILQTLQFTFMFAIPWFIQLAVEKHGAPLPDMVAAQSMITLISLLVPTPGATGGIEGLSYLFYGLFFTEAFIIPVILIYRLLTYYASAVIGGLFALLAPEKPLKRET